MKETINDAKKRFALSSAKNKHDLKEIESYDEMQQSEAGQKILFPAEDNPTLQLLAMLPDADLTNLREDLSCRTCPSSIWLRKVTELICWCPILSSVVWRSSKPRGCEILICSARQRSDEGEK